ncbi:MAG TPA: hypothetical protein VKR56_15190 [Candidatus Cybelea sp.]|nr:hypothetical protein [Candidatus Cybelea sp.]
MQSLILRRVLLSTVAVAALSGCGMRALPGATSLEPASSKAGSLPQSSIVDYLYVANEGATNGVSVVTFPQGMLVATITNIGAPTGACSDPLGNVWVSAYDDSTRKYYLYKFYYGGTKPVETIRVPGGAWGCTIDPTTGDLATWFPDAGSAGLVDVFPRARRGKPIVYYTKFQPVSGAFDNHHNFFADGIVNSGDFIFEELTKGSKTFMPIRLNKPTGYPGSVQWDGKHIVVGAGFQSEGPVLYRVRISGDRATVVQSVRLQQIASPATFWIQGGQVLANRYGNTVRQIDLYDYPAGGKRLHVFSGFYKPRGMTISVQPS